MKDAGARRGEITPEMWRELGQSLLRHKGLIVITFLGTVTIVYLALQLVTEKYDAEMQLLVKLGRENMEVPATVNNGGMYSTGVRKEELNSAIQLLTSQPLIERVIDTVGVQAFRFEPQRPSGLIQTLRYTVKQAVRWGKRRWNDLLVASMLKRRLTDREEVIELLKRALRAESVKDSDVIVVAVRLPDPGLGVKVLEGLLQVYLEQHLAVHRGPEVQGFFETQAAGLEARLKELRGAREKVRQQTQLSTYDEQSKLLLGRRGDLEREIEALKTRRAMILASRAMQGDPVTSGAAGRVRKAALTRAVPRLNLDRFPLPDPAADAVQDSLAESYLNLIRLSGSFDQTAQAVVKLNVEIALLEQLILRGLEMRIGLLGEQVQSLDKQLQSLNDGQEELRRLEMETRIAEANYENYVKRREEARISSELDRSRVANVAVLAPPLRPYAPVYPRKLLIMALALPFGLALGVLLTLLLEYFGGRGREGEDSTRFSAFPDPERQPLEDLKAG